MNNPNRHNTPFSKCFWKLLVIATYTAIAVSLSQSEGSEHKMIIVSSVSAAAIELINELDS